MKKLYVPLTLVVILTGVFAMAGITSAATDGKLGVDPATCTFTSSSGLLDIGGKSVFSADTTRCNPGLLADYMIALINFFFRLAIVLAVLMITIGGFQWLMAIGNSSKISNAKDTIQQAVVGLILAMTATLLFGQIDKSFTTFDKGVFYLVKPSDVNQGQSCLVCTTTAYKYQHSDAVTKDPAQADKDAIEWARGTCCTEEHGDTCEWKGGDNGACVFTQQMSVFKKIPCKTQADCKAEPNTVCRHFPFQDNYCYIDAGYACPPPTVVGSCKPCYSCTREGDGFKCLKDLVCVSEGIPEN